MTITKEQIIWLAGFMDGDGWFGLYKNKKSKSGSWNYVPVMGIQNTNKEIIDEIGSWFDCGSFATRIYKSPGWENRRNSFKYVNQDSIEILEIISLMIPYLKVKRERAELLLEYLEKRVKWMKEGRKRTEKEKKESIEYYEKMRKLNHRGR